MITVIGCGGGGCAVVSNIRDPALNVITLNDSDSSNIQLNGCAGDTLLASDKSMNNPELDSKVSDSEGIIAVATLGGGVGTGSIASVVRSARRQNIDCIVVAIMPLSVESAGRMEIARIQYNQICNVADKVLTVDHDTMVYATKGIKASEYYVEMDRILSIGVECLAHIMSGAFRSILFEKNYTMAYCDMVDPIDSAINAVSSGLAHSDVKTGKVVVCVPRGLAGDDVSDVATAIAGETGIYPDIVKKDALDRMILFIPIVYRNE